jgi:hypothetical protein
MTQQIYTPDSEVYFLSLCAQELAEVSEKGSWVEKVTKEPVHNESYGKFEYAGYQDLTYIWHVVKMNGISETKTLGRVVYQREYVANLQDGIPFRHSCRALPSEESYYAPSVVKPKTTSVSEPKIITFGKNRINLKAWKGETLKFKITGEQIWDIGG